MVFCRLMRPFSDLACFFFRCRSSSLLSSSDKANVVCTGMVSTWLTWIDMTDVFQKLVQNLRNHDNTRKRTNRSTHRSAKSVAYGTEIACDNDLGTLPSRTTSQRGIACFPIEWTANSKPYLCIVPRLVHQRCVANGSIIALQSARPSLQA